MPMSRLDTIRLILVLTTQHEWVVHHLDVKSEFKHGWVVHHLDVKSAFLNDDLQEEVYVAQPEGFVIKVEEQKVYKLSKALYGLRQALRAWNIHLDKRLKSLNFMKCSQE